MARLDNNMMDRDVTSSRARTVRVAGTASRSDSSYHVIARSGRWSVTRSGARRAARLFASRPEAVDYAVKVAGDAAAEVVVHEKDGSVAERIRPRVRPLTR